MPAPRYVKGMHLIGDAFPVEKIGSLRPVLAELRDLSANAIARELNARKIETPNGKPWSAVTVIRVQRRLEG
jgi:Recombinase